MNRVIATEESLIIETPERVPLEFSLASIGNRFLAVAIDHSIQFFAIFVIAWGFISLSGVKVFETGLMEQLDDSASQWVIALMIFVLFVLFSGYFVIFEWFWNGQTPGKRLLKLRVIRDDGRPITLWEALARNLIRIFDAIPGVAIPIYSVGLIAIFMNRRDQRIGDLFAGTVVIRERNDEAPTFAETFSSPISDPALRRVNKLVNFDADISGVKENEIEVVESFLRRRWDITERQRAWMAWRIALPIMHRLKPRYASEDFTYEGFLEELLHRYNARREFL